mgnify:CR=1 FL=1
MELAKYGGADNAEPCISLRFIRATIIWLCWFLPRSHAPRGNAYKDAPASRNAERFKLRSHVERGNEKFYNTVATDFLP